MGKTKIVYTIRPSADSLKLWKLYVSGGMDIVRCVFSEESCKDYIAWLRKMKDICKQSGRPVAILLDAEEHRIVEAASDMVQEIDFVAASSIHSIEDVRDIRRFLDENGCTKTQIIAKLDSFSREENIDSFLEAVDGIMLAKDGMKQGIPFDSSYQRGVIRSMRTAGKKVVTANQLIDFQAV